MVQNVTKYNALHKDSPKKEFINADPPLRFSSTKTFRSTSKAADDNKDVMDCEDKYDTEEVEEDNSPIGDDLDD